MRTTVDVPDTLYRRVKARAALKGQTVKSFVLEALREKLAGEAARLKDEPAWKAVFGAARAEDVAEVQRIIDEEFSKVDPEGW